MKKQSKTLFSAMLLICCLSLSAQNVIRQGNYGSYNGTDVNNFDCCGTNVTFTFYDDGHLVLEGTGEMYSSAGNCFFYQYHDGQNWVDFTSAYKPIRKVTVSEGITNIGDGFLQYVRSVREVNIPSTCRSLGQQSFGSGWNPNQTPYELTTINFAEGCEIDQIGNTYLDRTPWYKNQMDKGEPVYLGTTLFVCNTKATSLTVKPGTKKIYADAFNAYNKTNNVTLQEVILPESLTEIGEMAFQACSALDKVNFADTKITIIAANAFNGCVQLTDFTAPSTLRYLGKNAFNDCSALASVSITSAVQYEDLPFQGCSALTDVTLGNIKYVNGATQLFNYNAIERATLADGATNISDNLFSGQSNLSSVTLPASITNVGKNAFNGCSSITSISLPNSVTIGDRAFRNCKQLSTLIMPDVKTIGAEAFLGCESLAELDIRRSLRVIGDKAFSDCFKLATIRLGLFVPPFLPDNALYFSQAEMQHPTVKVYVPLPAYRIYKNEPQWQPNSDNTIQLQVGEFSGNLADGAISYALEGSTLRISGSGRIPDFNYIDSEEYPYNPAPWAEYADHITRVELSEGISYIGDNAFYGLVRLNALQISSATAADALCGDVADQHPLRNAGSRITLLVPIEKFAAYSSSAKWNLPNITLRAIGRENADITISATADPLQGSVIGSGSYIYGTTVTLTATAMPGYSFKKWSDGNKETQISFVAYKNEELKAEFAPISYLVSGNTNTLQGTVSGLGMQSFNSTVEIKASPREGYTFVQWSDNIKENPRMVTITRDTAFTAEFAPLKYNFTITSADEEQGTVTGSGEYLFGSETTIIASAADGYEFSRWSDGDRNEERDVFVESDTSLVAHFSLLKPLFSVLSENESKGTVRVLVEALPLDGFKFVKWSDDITENPREVDVTKSIELTAFFEIKGTPVDIDNSRITTAIVYGNNGTLHVKSADLLQSDYHVLDAAGRLIYTGRQESLQLPQGTYLVTIEGEIQKIAL